MEDGAWHTGGRHRVPTRMANTQGWEDGIVCSCCAREELHSSFQDTDVHFHSCQRQVQHESSTVEHFVGRRQMEVLRAIFLTAYDSFDVKNVALKLFSIELTVDVFQAPKKLLSRFYARGNKRKILEISDLTYF